jgi:hypothetical protein
MSRRPVRQAIAAAMLATATAVALAGCTGQTHTSPPIVPLHTPTVSATPRATGAAAAPPLSPAQKKVAALVQSEKSVSADVPAEGLVVASTPVATSNGAVSFHVAVTATGKDDYVVATSDFHSDVAGAPYQVFFRQFPEPLGSCIEDGVSFGYASWGGAGSTEQTLPAQVDLTAAGDDPSFLQNVVITQQPSDPASPCAWKVVGVAPLAWHAPDRHPGLAVHDSGPATGAEGQVTTVAGKPQAYLIAAGDTATDVEARFGVTLRDLVWLNARSGAALGFQLDSGQKLNLDPALR